MTILAAGDLNRRIRIETPVYDEEASSAGKEVWEPVCTAWASVQDMLPSRGERLSDGINAAARPARVRIRFRRGITSAMRVVIDGDRIAQIVSMPAELGFREALEFMVEEYTSAGGAR